MKRGTSLVVLLILVFIVGTVVFLKGTNIAVCDEQVVFTSSGELFAARLNTTGKKSLGFVGDSGVFDSVGQPVQVLLGGGSTHDEINELFLLSSGRKELVYKIPQTKNVGDESSYIAKAVFGKDVNDIFIVLVSEKPRARKSTGCLFRLDRSANKLVRLFEFNPSSGRLQYSRKLNALLVSVSSGEAPASNSVGLFSNNNNSYKTLVTAADLVGWIEDGQKFLFFSHKPGSGIYEFTFEDGKVVKKIDYSKNAEFSLARDKKCVIAIGSGSPELPAGCIDLIDISTGHSSSVSWKKQFQLSANEFPGDLKFTR